MKTELRQVAPDDRIAIRLLEAARSEIADRKAEADAGATSRKPVALAMLGYCDIAEIERM
jgi:hypothetical protein